MWTDEEYLQDFQEAVDRAVKAGMEPIYGNARALLFDLDSREDEKFFEEQLRRLKLLAPDLGAEEYNRWPSKSKGTHVLVKVDRDLEILERLLIQACLGSDRIHELLSLCHGHWKGNPTPTVLFKPKPKEPPKPTHFCDFAIKQPNGVETCSVCGESTPF